MKIIARRNQGRNPETGFITPVYIINETGTWDRVGNVEMRAEKFPNSGTVVIPRGFYQISDNYDLHEFFYVEIEPSTYYEETIPNSCKFQSLDAGPHSVSKLPLLIKGTFSQNGQIYLPYSGHRYIFFEDGEFIYGPISIFQTDQVDAENNDFLYIINVLIICG